MKRFIRGEDETRPSVSRNWSRTLLLEKLVQAKSD
jgi:hypothetical protein